MPQDFELFIGEVDVFFALPVLGEERRDLFVAALRPTHDGLAERRHNLEGKLAAFVIVAIVAAAGEK